MGEQINSADAVYKSAVPPPPPPTGNIRDSLTGDTEADGPVSETLLLPEFSLPPSLNSAGSEVCAETYIYIFSDNL